MAVKGKLIDWTRNLSVGQALRQRPELAQFLGYLLYFGLGLCGGFSCLFGSCGPFGIAMVAQAGGGLAGLFSLLGASIGYIAVGGMQWGIRYVATATLVYTAAFVFQSLKVSRTGWFMPLVTTAITGLTSALNAFEMARDLSMVVVTVSEVALAGGCTYLFKQAMAQTERNTDAAEFRHGLGLVVLLASMLMAFVPLTVMGQISVGRFLALVALMAISSRSGMLAGGAAGIALGAAMDLSGGVEPRYLVCYAFAGLFAAVYSKRGRFVFTLAFLVCSVLSALWVWQGELPGSFLFELFAACVVFMILPVKVLEAARLLSPSTVGKGETGLRVYSARRLRSIGEALGDLHDTIQSSLEESARDQDAAKVFDRAADTVCVKCENKSSCWHMEYLETLAVMNAVAPIMLEHGRLKEEDLPERFVEKCPSTQLFLTAVNAELRAQMHRRQFRSRLAEHRAAAFGQYADMARLFRDAAAELRAGGGAEPLAERRLQRYLQGRDLDCEVSVFRDRSGRLRASIEGGQLSQLLKSPDYLDKLSAVLGVRLCQPDAELVQREDRMTLLQAEPLTVSVGIAAMKKKGENCSGDRGTYFKTSQGELCVILSDGMGSGEAAARESVATVRILERFLKAGVAPGSAMKVLNSVMLLKNSEEWGFATADLLCVDLFTGESCFYKYGAAPSYVRTGKLIRRIKGKSLAVGLTGGSGAMPDVLRMRLQPGSVALIVSDGILVQDDDAWLRELMRNWDGTEIRELAKEALRGAVKQYGCVDDMTVLAVRLEKRE